MAVQWKGVGVVLGGMLVHLTLGSNPFSFGNLTPYVTSYLRRNRHDLDYGDSLWIYSSCVMCEGIALLLGGLMNKKLGTKATILFGSWLMSAGFGATYFTVKHSLIGVILTYGVVSGLGSGIAYSIPLACAMKWFPEWKGVAGSLILAAYGLSAFIFNQIQTRLINPDNLSPDVFVGGDKYFTQTELLDMVPWIFVLTGGMSALLQLLGVLLVTDPLPAEITVEGKRGPQIADTRISDKINRISTVSFGNNSHDTTARVATDGIVITKFSVGPVSQESSVVSLNGFSQGTTNLPTDINAIPLTEFCDSSRSRQSSCASFGGSSQDTTITYLDPVGNSVTFSPGTMCRQPFSLSTGGRLQGFDSIHLTTDNNTITVTEFSHNADSNASINDSVIIISGNNEDTPPNGYGTNVDENANSDIIKPAGDKRSEVNITEKMKPFRVWRTRAFLTLYICFLLNGQGIVFISAIYKEYGQIFIRDDAFLTIVGSLASIFNCGGRLFWGYLADRFSLKVALVSLCAAFSCLIFTFNVTPLGGKPLFCIYVCLLFGTFSGNYSLFSVAAANSFGLKNYNINYGLLFTSQAITAPLGAIIVSQLKNMIGWFGMFCTIGGISFLSQLLMMTFPEGTKKKKADVKTEMLTSHVNDGFS